MTGPVFFFVALGGLLLAPYAQAAETPPDPSTCSAQAPEACIALGDYEMGLDKFSTPPGPRIAEALAYFETACEGESAKGCRAAADASRKLPKTYAGRRNLKPAFKLYKKACSLGEPESCGIAGSFATNPNIQDDNLPDYQQAAQLLDRGCALNDALSCNEAYQLYSRDRVVRGHPGKSLPKDLEKASAYRDKTCDFTDSAYCRFKRRKRGGR